MKGAAGGTQQNEYKAFFKEHHAYTAPTNAETTLFRSTAELKQLDFLRVVINHELM